MAKVVEMRDFDLVVLDAWIPGCLVVLVESASSSAHTKLRFWKKTPTLRETNSLQAPENGCLEYVSFRFLLGFFLAYF